MERRLAAILAADVVGYSRLMEQDEVGTLAALKERRKDILAPLVNEHHGRIVKVMGDGVLVEFASAVNAVACALELQKRMAAANDEVPERQRIVLRIGINLGDVIVEGGDLYGDGVNIAARLQALAEPGGILVSAKLREEVGNKVNLVFDDLGDGTLKNIAAPIRVYRIVGEGRATGPAGGQSPGAARPSIAVLPFTNLSGDPEQRYFSDGITEDIITELSRFHSLFVIARNSSFQFRDKMVDAKQIGRDLGVDYIVEGSVRRMGTRLRITTQLIEAATGNHLWAERYDRDMQDIFEVQDEVVRAIVAALPGRIWEAGARSAQRKRPESLAAYDYLLRGIELHLTFDKADTQACCEMLEKALALDPTVAPAYAWLAASQLRDWWGNRSVQALDRAFVLAKKAVMTDGNDGFCHGMLGSACLERREFDDATFHTERSLALNPNDPIAAVDMGSLLAYLGRAEEGVAWIEKAFRLNPYAPQWYNSAYGMILFAAHRYTDAIAAFNRILAPPKGWEYPYLIASHGHLGRFEEARALAGECAALLPGISLLAFAAKEPFKNEADLEHLLDGLRKAGLSE